MPENSSGRWDDDEPARGPIFVSRFYLGAAFAVLGLGVLAGLVSALVLKQDHRSDAAAGFAAAGCLRAQPLLRLDSLSAPTCSPC